MNPDDLTFEQKRQIMVKMGILEPKQGKVNHEPESF